MGKLMLHDVRLKAERVICVVKTKIIHLYFDQHCSLLVSRKCRCFVPVLQLYLNNHL